MLALVPSSFKSLFATMEDHGTRYRKAFALLDQGEKFARQREGREELGRFVGHQGMLCLRAGVVLRTNVELIPAEILRLECEIVELQSRPTKLDATAAKYLNDI
jgi:hypothetical protein